MKLLAIIVAAVEIIGGIGYFARPHVETVPLQQRGPK